MVSPEQLYWGDNRGELLFSNNPIQQRNFRWFIGYRGEVLKVKQQLTKNFQLWEFERSAKAKIFKIKNNVPTLAHYLNLENLAEKTLQPLREKKGRIKITSGYRCPKLNRQVGGSDGSQHMLGEAADIVPLDCTIYEAYNYIKTYLPHDQCILEKWKNPKTGEVSIWIHVSLKRLNRKQSFIKEVK